MSKPFSFHGGAHPADDDVASLQHRRSPQLLLELYDNADSRADSFVSHVSHGAGFSLYEIPSGAHLLRTGCEGTETDGASPFSTGFLLSEDGAVCGAASTTTTDGCCCCSANESLEHTLRFQNSLTASRIVRATTAATTPIPSSPSRHAYKNAADLGAEAACGPTPLHACAGTTATEEKSSYSPVMPRHTGEARSGPMTATDASECNWEEEVPEFCSIPVVPLCESPLTSPAAAHSSYGSDTRSSVSHTRAHRQAYTAVGASSSTVSTASKETHVSHITTRSEGEMDGHHNRSTSTTPLLRVHWCCPAHWRAVQRMERAVQSPPVVPAADATAAAAQTATMSMQPPVCVCDVYCVATHGKRERKERTPPPLPIHPPTEAATFETVPLSPQSLAIATAVAGATNVSEKPSIEVRTLPAFLIVSPTSSNLPTRRPSAALTNLPNDSSSNNNTCANMPHCEFCGKAVEAYDDEGAVALGKPGDEETDGVVRWSAALSPFAAKHADNALTAVAMVRSPVAYAQSHRRYSARCGCAPHTTRTAATSNRTSISTPVPMSSSNSSFASSGEYSVSPASVTVEWPTQCRVEAMLAAVALMQ